MEKGNFYRIKRLYVLLGLKDCLISEQALEIGMMWVCSDCW